MYIYRDFLLEFSFIFGIHILKGRKYSYYKERFRCSVVMEDIFSEVPKSYGDELLRLSHAKYLPARLFED